MSHRRRRLLLLGVIGLAIWLVFHLYSFSGMKGYDGIEYARHAVELLQGRLDLSDHHFAYRWGVVFPAALCYKLLGVNDLSSSLPAMLASFLMLLIMLRICRDSSLQQQIFVLLFFCLSPNILYYWDKLMPDIQVAMGALLAFWARYECGKDGDGRWGILLAAGIFWALLSKASVILVLPVFLFLFLEDLIKRRDWKFWGMAAAAGGILLLLYFGSIYQLTGNAFSRFERIMARGYLNTCSYDQLELKFLLKRIGYELVQTWSQNGTFIAFLPLLAAVIFLRKQFGAEQQFWVKVGLLSFLSANFMSISFESYVPMCADERHLLFVIAPWALGSGLCLPAVLRKPGASLLMGILALLLMLWTEAYVQWLYGLFALGSFWGLIPIFQRRFSIFGFLLLGLSLLVVPINYAIYLKGLFYKEHKKALFQWMDQQSQPSLVVTNAVQERIGNYHQGFDSAALIQFREFGEIEASWSEKKPETFLLVNAYDRFMSGMDWSDLPVYAREIPDILKPVYKVGHSELYALPDISWVQMPTPFWEDSLVYGRPEGENEKLEEAEVVLPKSFGKGWEIPFSDIAYEEGRLWIRAELHIRNMDQGEANWQVHVDDSLGNNLQWKSASLKHRTPVPGKWVVLNIDHLLDIADRPSDLLKLRLWNDGPARYEIARLKAEIAYLPKKEGPSQK